MNLNSILPLLTLFALAAAHPMPKEVKHLRREVPQEHSHEQFLTTVRTSLNLNNPAGIGDPVFGLLGNQAAAGGLGQIADVECLQQATADQAFTNAKAANDIPGMTAALVYRALERNTAQVGQASNACTSIQAVNPEIATFSQHQDPASQGATERNKAIALELAKQIAAVGGDPQDALKSGTFQPGDLTDTSGKGNTCDNPDDPEGCIFTQNLLVEDATPDEITAVAGGAVGGNSAASAVEPTTNITTKNASIAATAAPAAQPESVQLPAGDAQQSGCGAAQSNPSPVSADLSLAAAGAQGDGNSATAETAALQSAPAGLDLGSCPNAGIVFGPGFDGRKENSFQPADTTQFQHGSALNIDIITKFMCDRFGDSCAANDAAKAACVTATAATKGKTGQAAATAWNDALGLTNVPNLTGV